MTAVRPQKPSRPVLYTRRVLRLLWAGLRTHTLRMSRSRSGISALIIVPLIYASLTMLLFRAGTDADRVLDAAVGAGLMGAWSSVLLGSGGAIQNERWMGTLESLVVTPAPLPLIVLPITLATAVVGGYALLATLLWGAVVFRVPLHFADPLLFILAAGVNLLALGMTGMLLSSVFVLLRNASLLTNPLSAPVWLLSGMLVPVSALPPWTRPISWLLPPTWGAEAMRGSMHGDSVLKPVALCALLGCLHGAVGAIGLRLMERRARVTGSLRLA